MKSPIAAMGWEIWARNRWGFLAVLGALIAAAGIEGVAAISLGVSRAGLLQHPSLVERGDEVGWAVLALLLIMVASLVSIFVLFSYTETDYATGEPRFPSRTFHLPISTLRLAGLPMAGGALAGSVVYFLWRQFVFAPVGIFLPVTLPVVSLLLATLSLQALVWGLPGLPALRLLALSAVFVVFAAINFCTIAEIRTTGGPLAILENFIPPWPPGRIEGYNRGATGAAVFLAVAAAGMAVQVVGRNRRGKWRGFKASAVGPATSDGHFGAPFASRGAAQFWFEWRRNGTLLPWVTAGFSLILLLPLPLLIKMDAPTTQTVFFAALGVPLLLAAVVGLGFGKLDFWSKEFALSPFLSNWPITNAQIITAKLKVAALATALSWLVAGIAVSVWLVCWGDRSLLARDWADWQDGPGFLAVGLGALAAGLLTWRFMIGSIHWGVWGRPKYFFLGALGGNLAGLGLAVGGYFFFCTGSGASYRQLSWFPYLPWILAFVLALKLTAGAWGFSTARRRQLLSGAFVITYVLFWLASSACLVGVVFFLQPHVAWKRHLLALAVLLAMPLARISVAPLALDWNRHRRLRSSGGGG